MLSLNYPNVVCMVALLNQALNITRPTHKHKKNLQSYNFLQVAQLKSFYFRNQVAHTLLSNSKILQLPSNKYLPLLIGMLLHH